MNRNLLILGAGQYGMVAREVADCMPVKADVKADWAIRFKKNFGAVPSVY